MKIMHLSLVRLFVPNVLYFYKPVVTSVFRLDDPSFVSNIESPGVV